MELSSATCGQNCLITGKMLGYGTSMLLFHISAIHHFTVSFFKIFFLFIAYTLPQLLRKTPQCAPCFSRISAMLNTVDYSFWGSIFWPYVPPLRLTAGSGVCPLGSPGWEGRLSQSHSREEPWLDPIDFTVLSL